MLNKRLMLIGLPVMLAMGVLSTYAAQAQTLAQIVEEAKKEHTVSAKLRSGLTPKSMGRLESEIREKFDVNLSITATPATIMPRDLADALMEYKAGAIPSYDLMTLSTEIPRGMKEGLFERVDWRPLITKNTDPNVIHESSLFRGAIVYFTTHTGLMYNPEKVPVGEVPKTLSDLANPKWKGKVGLHVYPGAWCRWAFIIGKEKVLSNLRTILKNGSIQGAYADLYNRYLIGEISLAVQSSEFGEMANEKGVPAAWQSLDFSDIGERSLVVRSGAKHPNAAKLVAIYLASPEGAKFILEESGTGNLYYPGNYEHDIRSQDKGHGINEVFGERKPELLQFYDSKEFDQWQKEVDLIFKLGR